MNSRIFFFHFGSFITAKMSIKERNQGWFQGGDSIHGERSTPFLNYAKLGEFAVKYSDDVTVEVDILCHTLAFFALRRLIVISRERS